MDSPYYLPGITNNAVLVEEVEGRSASKAFRIMGAPAGDPKTSQLALTFENAYRACQDVGLGLAAILDDSQKSALDKLFLKMLDVYPDGVVT